jgi:integrase
LARVQHRKEHPDDRAAGRPDTRRAEILPCKTKGSHRTIRLDAETVAALEAHRERQLVEREAAADAYVDSDLMFADKVGGLIHPQRLTQRFGALRKAAKVRPDLLHDVRTRMRPTCSRLESLCMLSSPATATRRRMVTLGVYAHVLPTSDEEAAEVIAEVLAATAR